MPTIIHERVRLAQQGKNPYVISRLEAGWVVIGDVQPLRGYCLLLPDPVVKDLNVLPENLRLIYCRDVARVGDALLQVTDAYRINYETWGNGDQALHTHITPRYRSEPDEKRTWPACMVYDWKTSPPFDPMKDKEFVDAMRIALRAFSL